MLKFCDHGWRELVLIRLLSRQQSQRGGFGAHAPAVWNELLPFSVLTTAVVIRRVLGTSFDACSRLFDQLLRSKSTKILELVKFFKGVTDLLLEVTDCRVWLDLNQGSLLLL